ncbi:hypothetical protein A3D76_01520 [Candidatus Roizmanbacteria bacterium RIFCSPHIGHO2_02_FULL_37_9b]|nr:MAG: hypothetical protein A3D76_01520 [Candidatus Roizmanbacteria bacterium RIFCSPHIGHO2_02_FULL_37_9b]
MRNKLELRLLTGFIGFSLLTQACHGIQPNPQESHTRLPIGPTVLSNNMTELPSVALAPTPNLIAFPTSTPITNGEPNYPTAENEANLKVQEFKIFIDPSLVPDIEFAKENLSKYVTDMNFILAKNTNRRLSFNPETDIILTSTQPQSDSCSECPEEGFEIWSHIAPRENIDYPLSYGGYLSFDNSGAGVLAGLHWTKIYNPDNLIPNTDETRDYWSQIDDMLHEFAHVHGAGWGEYFKLAMEKDTTGVDPILDINLYDPNDPFWSNKRDFFSDPLLMSAYDNPLIGNPTSRADLLAKTKFSTLTATILNGSYRKGAPITDLSNLNIQITDRNTGLPISGAKIKIWYVQGISDSPSGLLYDNASNEQGGFSFGWGSQGDPHNNYDFLRLIKVYKDGYAPVAMYVSVFDLEIQKLLEGKDIYSTTISLEPAQ